MNNNKKFIETPSTPPPKGVWLTCPKCGYHWYYRGEMPWANCPKCKARGRTPYHPKLRKQKAE